MTQHSSVNQGYGFCIEDNEQDYVMIRLSFSPAGKMGPFSPHGHLAWAAD